MAAYRLLLGKSVARFNTQQEDDKKHYLLQAAFKGVTKKTEPVVPEGIDVSWPETLEWDLVGQELEPGDFIKVKIFDQAKYRKNKLLGKATIQLGQLVDTKESKAHIDIKLNDGHGNPTEYQFSCDLEYVHPKATDPDAEKNGHSAEEVDKEVSAVPTLSRNKRSNEPKKRKYSLPNKPMDFQVRIKIIEARQLEGNDINPVTRVTIGRNKQQTQTKRSTDRPYYNQTLFFNFSSITPDDLFNQTIVFEVFNTRLLRTDSLIGYFKCNVGFVYQSKDHMLLRKWIALTEIDDHGARAGANAGTQLNNSPTDDNSSDGGSMTGYLKASMVVLEPGATASSFDETSRLPTDDDIESNLLCPPGVTFTQAFFMLKVFRAEDLPQMDSSIGENLKKTLRIKKKDKDLVDPYCVFSFAGAKATSEIIYSCNHPNFNETLNVPFQFPTMCDKLKIQLVDWDRLTEDDIIGTKFLDLSSISGHGGAGFLPCFGPCYINLYGSTREYAEMADDYEELNEGIGEGAAYRGRVLVQLETNLNEKIQKVKTPVPNEDIVKVQPYLRRSKFLLRASFFEATMLCVQDSPVEFEVSIGNYGNKLNNSFNPASSSTPPTNPIFDGERYFFLPWGGTKPCVRVDSHWEDISFRLGVLNRLLKARDRLEKNIDLVRTVQSKGVEEDTIKALTQILDQLLDDCRALPKLNAQMVGVTSLDLQMHATRNSVLNEIASDAYNLRNNITSVDEALDQAQEFLAKFRIIAIEPQNSMPDVIIWMLKGGNDRVAYCRIPAYELLYLPEEEQRGKHCGKIIDLALKYPWKSNSVQKDIPGLLRVMLWLGLEEHHGEWDELKKTGGELSVYAETYENQMWFGQWTSKGLSRHAFSNAKGTLNLPKDKFIEPTGWKFDGSWFIAPEISTQYSKDSGHKSFQEDAFQNEYRMFPGGKWLPSTDAQWTDIHGQVLTDDNGEPIKTIKSIKPPEGWIWAKNKDWMVDLNRAVDNNGWEYAVETSFGSSNFEAVEKNYHFSRRRRFVRERITVSGDTGDASSGSKASDKDTEGWEYAKTFTTTFRSRKKGFSMVRRRRWHRKLVRRDPKAPEPVLTVQTTKKDKDEDEPVLNAPRIFLFFKKPHLCQLRVHLYQARNILPSDSNGLADPYVQLSFGTRSAMSKIVFKKLNPAWDQMLVLQSLPIYGHYEQVAENPPDIILELLDYDAVGKHDLLGRVQTEPIVFLPNQQNLVPTKLSWHKILNDSEHCGDILAAFELFVDEKSCAPALPLSADSFYPIPQEIRPAMQRTGVEVLCWGLRNIKRFRGMKLQSPIAQIEIGGEVRKTAVIKSIKKNPNFQGNRLLYFDMDLPNDEMHILPITIRIRDHQSFGRNPTIGVCILDSVKMFRANEPGKPMSESAAKVSTDYSAIDMTQDGITEVYDGDENENVDWWSKYHASRPGIRETPIDYPESYDRIKIYDTDLETQFDHFQDFIKTFPLRRGRIKASDSDEDCGFAGEFKGTFCIYNLPEDRSVPSPPRFFTEERLPQAKPINCLVRVYVVKAYGLTPQDLDGLADPYLRVSLGKQCYDERDQHASSTLEVDFGRVFEFNACIPLVKDLKVTVMDYDVVSADDLIGETVIDLENRLLSLRHAIFGLPQTYSISGPNKWRFGANYTPTVILDWYCRFNNLSPPRYNGSSLVMVNGVPYALEDFEENVTDMQYLGPDKERLALYVLHSFERLVPEHVETRELMNSLQPGFPQGKIELFVDIFPDYIGSPLPPIDISPRVPKRYELRVIVWNTKDVYLQESNLAGEKMSDIYVKCWLSGINKRQSTDTHYRSLNGEGMFNWRMVFPFEYLEAEKMMAIKKKEHFWNLNKKLDKLRPQLVVQIWDNDIISPDDFIGAVTLDLEELPLAFSNPSKIKDHMALVNREKQSLFAQRRVYGWWPVKGKVKEKAKSKKQKAKSITKLTGKVEMTLELVDGDDIENRAVGKGQDEPNQHPVLQKPKRPETSFLWFANPFKSFRYIIWKNYKWHIIGLILLILIVLLVVLFIYAAPGYSVKKLMGT